MTRAVEPSQPRPTIDGPAPVPAWRRWQVAAAIACVVVLYLSGVTNSWWPTPDSALYQGLGRSLIRGDGYRFNGGVNTEVTPGMPAILGALRWAFGDGYWAPNLFVTCCGLGALALAYATLARRTDRTIAFAAVLGTAVCYRYYDYSHLILTDATFSVLFWLMAYACVRGLEGTVAWLGLAAVVSAAIVVVRAPGLLIVGAWAGGLVVDRASGARLGRRIAVAAAALVPATAVGAGFYWLARAVSGEQPPYAAWAVGSSHLLGRLMEVLWGFWRLPGALTDVFTGEYTGWLRPVGIVLAVLALVGAVVLWRRGKRLAAGTCALNFLATCLLVGHLSIRARYMMAIYPLILLLIFQGLFQATEAIQRRRGRPTGPAALGRAMAVFLIVLTVANAFKIVRRAVYYAYCGHVGRYLEVIEGGRYRDLYEAAATLRRHFGPNARIASRWDRARMLHYLSGRKIEMLIAQWDRWKPCHADALYNDFRSRPYLDAFVFDTGGLVESYTSEVFKRFDAAPDLKILYRGKYVTIYERAGRATPGPAGEPASRRG